MPEEEKKVWTQDEFEREVHPVRYECRAFKIETRGPFGHLDLVLAATDGEGRNYYLGEPRWHLAQGIAAVPELASIPADVVQRLFDSMWEAGLRPTEDPVGPRLDAHERAIRFLVDLSTGNDPAIKEAVDLCLTRGDKS
jgi:hypothetical protein